MLDNKYFRQDIFRDFSIAMNLLKKEKFDDAKPSD